MCFSAPKAPPPPTPVVLPPAPSMQTISAPTLMQGAPARPKDAPETNPSLRRRGKRGLTIPLTTAPGTNIPGM